jgi:hypothetical protein
LFFFDESLEALLPVCVQVRLSKREGRMKTKEERKMSQNKMMRVSTLIAALVLVLSIGLQSLSAKDSKADTSAIFTLQNATSLAGQSIAPGDYKVTVTETQLTRSKGGKVVAQVPVQWKDETTKATRSAIVTDGNKITEFHFGGKNRYVAVAAS